MDCTDLSELADESFDIIIEKATIDSLVCSTNQAYRKVAFMMKECQRVLKRGGFFISISSGKPENREFHFQRPHLNDMSFKAIQLDDHNHAYVMRKTENGDAQSWSETLEQIKCEESEQGQFDSDSDSEEEENKESSSGVVLD